MTTTFVVGEVYKKHLEGYNLVKEYEIEILAHFLKDIKTLWLLNKK